MYITCIKAWAWELLLRLDELSAPFRSFLDGIFLFSNAKYSPRIISNSATSGPLGISLINFPPLDGEFHFDYPFQSQFASYGSHLRSCETVCYSCAYYPKWPCGPGTGGIICRWKLHWNYILRLGKSYFCEILHYPGKGGELQGDIAPCRSSDLNVNNM